MKTKTHKGRSWGILSPKVLRKAREREGMSRKALAERLGVSPGAIQNWESDASTPTPEMQAKIADTLKIAGDQPVAQATGAPTEVLANALANVVTDRALDAALVPEKDVSDAAAHVVSAMIHKGLLANLDEIKAALASVCTALRG